MKRSRGRRAASEPSATPPRFAARLDENLAGLARDLAEGDVRGRPVSSVHDLRPEGATDHGAVFSRPGAASCLILNVCEPVFERLPDRRHVRLPARQGPASGRRAGQAVRAAVRLVPQARHSEVFQQHRP